MDKQVEIHAYHGWGADSSFWEPLRELLPKDILFKAADRGYTGKVYYPRFEKETKIRIVFTHSYGLHWCNTAVLSKADFLVIFNGFGSFFPIQEGKKHMMEKGLESMILNFSTHKEQVLQSFYENVFFPDPKPAILPELTDEAKALSDLKILRKTRFPFIDLDFGAKMISVDGAKDRVLLEPRGEEILSAYVGKKDSKVFADLGHALPFTNPVDCWSYLCSVIPIFERYEN